MGQRRDRLTAIGSDKTGDTRSPGASPLLDLSAPLDALSHIAETGKPNLLKFFEGVRMPRRTPLRLPDIEVLPPEIPPVLEQFYLP